jgi:hypothetical protein
MEVRVMNDAPLYPWGLLRRGRDDAVLRVAGFSGAYVVSVGLGGWSDPRCERRPCGWGMHPGGLLAVIDG